MRVVGGLEIPGSRHGEIGAFVAEISPGGVVHTHGEVQEGKDVEIHSLTNFEFKSPFGCHR